MRQGPNDQSSSHTAGNGKLVEKLEEEDELALFIESLEAGLEDQDVLLFLAQGSPVSLVSISDSGFGIMSLSCSGVKLPVGGLLESGGLC